MHWKQSWLHHSKVHQRWRQEAIHYIVLEAPFCQMNGNWLYQYPIWPYRCTDYSTPFAVNWSLSVSESMQSWTHIECSSGFLSRGTRSHTFSSCHVKFEQFIPLSISRCFFFGQSSKRLSADRLRCEHRRFNIATSVGDLFSAYSQISDRGANFSQSKRVFSCSPMRGFRESCLETSQNFFHMPQYHLQASTKRTYVRYTRPFLNDTPQSQLRTNWIGIKWQTWSRLKRTASATHDYNVHIHIQLFSPNLDKSRERPLVGLRVAILAACPLPVLAYILSYLCIPVTLHYKDVFLGLLVWLLAVDHKSSMSSSSQSVVGA